MQWHKSRDRDPGTLWLRSILKSVLQQTPAGEAMRTKPRAKVANLRRHRNEY